jgi:AcrR family transcriptional regulator
VCFARTGYAATTNKDIAVEAGVTAAAIYLYFESKTALYLATARDAYAELVPRYRAAVDGTTSMREGFRALLAESARIHAEDPTLAAFFSGLPIEMRRHAELTQATAEAGVEVVEIFSKVVNAGVRAGELQASAANDALALFIACTMGFSLYAATIDGQQITGILQVFGALIDGKLFSLGNPVGVPQTPPAFSLGNPVGVPQTPPIAMPVPIKRPSRGVRPSPRRPPRGA